MLILSILCSEKKESGDKVYAYKCKRMKERIIYQSYDGYLIAVRHCIKIDMCLFTRFVSTYICGI